MNHRYTRNLTLCLLFKIGLISGVLSAAPHEINISGAGPSTKIVATFFNEFKKHNPKYENLNITVPPRSIKHAGGISWSNKHLFGRTGRSLNSNEKRKNKDQILLAKVPAVFVIGKNIDVYEMSYDQLKQIYQKKITNWKTLGGPDEEIILVGREPTEAIHLKLKKLYPFMIDHKYWFTFTRDHQIQGFINSKKGANGLSFGAKPNFSSNSIVKITGEQTGVSIGLVYDLKNKDEQLLQDVSTFSKTKAWRDLVNKQGYLTIQ